VTTENITATAIPVPFPGTAFQNVFAVNVI